MNDFVVRLALVVLVVGLALALARLWPVLDARRRGRRPVEVGGLDGPWPAIVVFTSDDCGACALALEVVESVAGEWPVLRMRYESRPEAFREAGVEAVPHVVVVGEDGRVVEQFAGVPDRRRLAASLRG